MVESILINVFVSFPEAIFVVLLGFRLSNIKINLKNVIKVAVIQSMLAFIVKFLHIPFGAHTIIQIIIFCLITSLVLRIKLYKSIVPILIGFSIQGIIQAIIVPIAKLFIELDFLKLNVDFIYTFIFSIPITTTSLLLFILIKKTNFTLCDVSLEG